MLDGYFAALICGPDMVPLSEYLSQIWGEDFAFESDEQTAEIMGLLMRHWNTIATELLHTLDKPDVYHCFLAASSWMTVHTFCSAMDFSPDKRTASIRSLALPNRWPSSVKLP